MNSKALLPATLSLLLWLTGLSARASHDSFLFGVDEKITTWNEGLTASDLGLKSFINSGWQTDFNQIMVDQYLARALLDQNAHQTKSFKQIEKVSRDAERLLVRKYSRANRFMLRAEQILQLRISAHEGSLGRLEKELVAFVAAQKIVTVKEVPKVLNKKAPLIKLTLPGAYKFALDLAKDLKNSEPENSQSLLIALNILSRADAKVKTMSIQTTSENLYADGLALFKQGKFEEAEAKLRQALVAYEQGKEKRLLLGRETTLLLAQSLSALDRKEEAMQHFSSVIENLKHSPLSARPQTDETVEEFVRLAEIALVDLPLPPEPGTVLQQQKDKIVHSLHALVSAAYLCKIDGRLSEAAHLFRRANLINKHYFPELDDLRSSIAYDLGETLHWSGSSDEAEHYMTEALRLREKNGKGSDAAVDTRSTLGRILLAAERGEYARRFYLETMQILAARELNKAPGKEHGQVENLQALSFEELGRRLAPLADQGSLKRQLSDALQGYADASIACKRYDEATTSDAILLAMRETRRDEREQVLATLWQMAWVAQMANQFEQSAQLYTRMIKDFPGTKKRQLADWYQSRAIALDLLGRYKEATSDFKQARDLFKACLKAEHDLDEIDRLTWTVDDIEYNLLSRHKSPPTDADYLRAEPFSYWQATRFPLKVFVEKSTTNGFGGELKKLMLKAMAQWTDFEGSPVKLAFVDNAADADVYIERVTSYDDIPYSSAGRTSVVYVNGDAAGKVLDRAHVRVYCPSYDGESSVKNGIDKIINQEMSSFAKTHLYTLFMHEFGHVIGVGHSPAGQDVMYWKSCSTDLSNRDKESIRRLYLQHQK